MVARAWPLLRIPTAEEAAVGLDQDRTRGLGMWEIMLLLLRLGYRLYNIYILYQNTIALSFHGFTAIFGTCQIHVSNLSRERKCLLRNYFRN